MKFLDILFCLAVSVSSSSVFFAEAFAPSPRGVSTSPSTTRLFQTAVQQLEDRYLELANQSEGVMSKPEIVYLLMYNPGTPEEGVHTTEYPKESGQEVVLGFEMVEEAFQFAQLLKEEPSFPLEPVPTPTPLAQMETVCQQMGLSIKVVPSSA